MLTRLKLLSVLTVLVVACSDNKKNDGALTVRIVEPNGTATILKSTAVRLRATFADGTAEVTPSKVTWESSIVADVIPQTNPAENVVLAEGEHNITVKGTYGKKSGQASMILTVGDVGVEIVRPSNNRQVAPGATVTLQGAATTRVGASTVNLNPTNATFAWDADGVAFGTNQNTLLSPNTLAVGDHTITLTVSFVDGTTGTTLTGQASIVLKVNTVPAVAITAPTCPIDLEAGATQVFAGVASDAEDGPLTGEWVDLLTNAQQAGDTWTYSTSAVGKHEIAYSATDSSDAIGKATCGVRVYPVGGSVASIFPSTATVNSALPDPSVETVSFDSAGNLLVGEHGELVILDPASALINDGAGATNPYSGNELGVGGGTNVNDVAVSGGQLLAATDDGLAHCTYTGGNLSACTDIGNGGTFDAVAGYGDLSVSAVVAASAVDGVLIATFNSGTINSHFYGRNVLSTHDDIHDVLFVGAALYVATDSGVCVINDPAAAVATVAVTLCDSVIDVNNARTLAVSGTTLWIGSDAGLTRTSIGSTSSLTLSHDDGLPSNDVNDITIGPDGTVWIATSNGVGRLDAATNNIVTLRPPDWTGSSNVRSIAIAPDGSKWFGTAQGVVHYVGG